MAIMCQDDEYYDDVFSECFPCASLCRRGEGATKPCKEHCPGFKAKSDHNEMMAPQKVMPLMPTPPPAEVTEVSFSFTVIILIISTSVLIVILLLLVFYIGRRKYTKKMTAGRTTKDEENVAVHTPHSHTTRSVSNHSIQQFANEEQAVIHTSDPRRSYYSGQVNHHVRSKQANRAHPNSFYQEELHLLNPSVEADMRQMSEIQNNQISNQEPQDHHSGRSSMVMTSIEYRTQNDGLNNSQRKDQHHEDTPLMKIPYQEFGPSCQLDDILSDAEECIEDVQKGLPEKSYYASLQTNMGGDRATRAKRLSSGYSSMESDRTDVAKKSVKEVFAVLDQLEPCRSYFEDDGIIVIMVLFEMITYLDLIRILRQKTGWAEIDFRIRTYMPSRFELYSLVPGRRVMKRVSDEVRHRMAALGCYIKKKHQQDVYALSVAHLYNVGDKAYFDDSTEPIGECVETVRQEYPMHLDLAIIKLYDDHEAVDNIVFSAQGNPCTLQFPNEKQIQDKIQYKCQRKSNGTWQYCYFRYAEYTNKEVGLYRTRVCIRAHEACPVIRQGDCGCLLTSLPQSSNQLLVLGMLVGRVAQEAEDGGDPIEYYIAFNLEEALRLSTTFDGTGYEFCPGISEVHI